VKQSGSKARRGSQAYDAIGLQKKILSESLIAPLHFIDIVEFRETLPHSDDVTPKD
jgi:hypothetical protein